MEDIRDDYKHLSFGQPNSVDDLKLGMMVQMVESNKQPLCWHWYEITENVFLKLKENQDKLEWVRIPIEMVSYKNTLAELKVTNSLLEEQERVLAAIPECEVHGACIPHALEWVEKQKNPWTLIKYGLPDVGRKVLIVENGNIWLCSYEKSFGDSEPYIFTCEGNDSEYGVMIYRVSQVEKWMYAPKP